MYDVLIVGAGPAGLSAALILGRSRRRVLVLDSGKPRNAPSPESHGFFTRDGATPAELLRLGREQLRPYDVEVRDAEVTDAVREESGFTVVLADGSRESARTLLLATGMVDPLPEIEGLRELWGTGVLHCPYCHGWEVRDRPLGVYGNGKAAAEFVALLRVWSRDLVLCTDGPADLEEEDRERLARHGVPVREERIVRLVEKEGRLERIVFADGGDLSCGALFLRVPPRQHSRLGERLGSPLRADGLMDVDQAGRTSIPGLYAAGDISLKMNQVGLAAADGAVAGVAINHDLALQEFA